MQQFNNGKITLQLAKKTAEPKHSEEYKAFCEHSAEIVSQYITKNYCCNYDAAKQMGVSVVTIRNWISGRIIPKENNYKKFFAK